MPTDDFRINATVRSLLVRFWIDTGQLTHGAVNGVVYLKGRLRKETLRAEDSDDTEESPLLLVRRLERALREVNGVRDVVYNLEHITKVKGRWVQRKTA